MQEMTNIQIANLTRSVLCLNNCTAKLKRKCSKCIVHEINENNVTRLKLIELFNLPKGGK